MEHAAVDRHVAALHLDALVVRVHGQAAAALKAQRYHGVDRAVILDAVGVFSRVGAGNPVFGAVGQLDGQAVFAGRARLQRGQPQDRRGRAAGQIDAVENQPDAVRPARAHDDLHVRRLAADAVAARRGDVHHPVDHVLQRLGHVRMRLRHPAQIDRRGIILRDFRAVHRDARLRDHDRRPVVLRQRHRAHQRAERQQNQTQPFHIPSAPSDQVCGKYTLRI